MYENKLEILLKTIIDISLYWMVIKQKFEVEGKVVLHTNWQDNKD